MILALNSWLAACKALDLLDGVQPERLGFDSHIAGSPNTIELRVGAQLQGHSMVKGSTES